MDLAVRLPVKIEFIESAEKVEELLPKLQALAGTGLIEMHDTTIVKPAEKNQKQTEPGRPALKREGKAKMMRIYIGENDKWNGKPLYDAIVNGLRSNDIAGVTVYRGILGYGANRRIHKDTTLSLSHDRPILLSVVDTEDKLKAFMPVLDQMVQQGLVVLSDVDIIKSVSYTHLDVYKRQRLGGWATCPLTPILPMRGRSFCISVTRACRKLSHRGVHTRFWLCANRGYNPEIRPCLAWIIRQVSS